LGDLALSTLEGSVWLIDRNPVAGEHLAQLGNLYMTARRTPLTVQYAASPAAALDGADVVLLSITTGGLAAMQGDLEIPATYGIHQAVGDTVGPGGIARGLRNIPVILELARQMEHYCPHAWLINVTNPMTTLSRAVTRATSIRTIGLCHGLRDVQQRLAEVLGSDEGVTGWQVAGINHLPWVVNPDRATATALETAAAALPPPDPMCDPFDDNLRIKLDLLETYGTFPAVGDRHVAEFFPHYLRSADEAFDRYGVRLTTIAQGQANRAREIEVVLRALDRRESIDLQYSGEQAVPVIEALAGLRTGGEFVVNVPNEGQIEGVLEGAVVECMASIDRQGVHPRPATPLPTAVLAWTQIHVAAQELVVRAALEKRADLALQALLLDPLCHRLSRTEGEGLLRALVANNERFA